jgi:phosphomannomutase
VSGPAAPAGKAEWRAWARDRRRRIDMEATSEAIVEHLRLWGKLGGRTRVLLYDPLPDEPDLTALASSVVALLTRTPDDGELTVHHFDAEREVHGLGFGQPVAGSTVVDPTAVDVALVPGLAFDRSGTRLGRGGGHYDRLLTRLRPEAITVGVAPAALVVEALPSEDHDVRLTHLVTEEGVVEAGRVPAVAVSLVTAALDWIAGDPDPKTRAELQAAVDGGDVDGLRSLMGASLRFGTAGIRGPVGAGSNRMNRATVIRVTAGLADHLVGAGRGEGPVVVGFDARPTSRRFAEDAVGVLGAAGIAVRFFDEAVPTPLVAHAALTSGAVAAVVVTASHNPPSDNGYKVYDANGAQIVPPTDVAISEAIDRVGPAVDVPRLDDPLSGRAPGTSRIGDEATKRYIDDVLAFRGDSAGGPSPSIVFTPLHGVSGRLVLDVLAAAGHTDVSPVPAQFEPDGRFPTVAFPNPEEPGALDMAEDLAAELDAGLVLANDPDGDRLAVSVPVDGGWRRLTGNEIGILLADFVLHRTGHVPDRLVVSSIVSSPMLAAVAAAHDAVAEVTLTGFKWICNAALALKEQGRRFVFGYEEALGYSVGPVVRDKDGISAAVWFADLAAACASDGETVLDRLARLYVRHGLWSSVQRTIVGDGPRGLATLTARLDRLVGETPPSLGGLAVDGVTDYRSGGEARPRWLPDTPLVIIHLEGGSRAVSRPSGTEPKLKIYAEARHEVASTDEVPSREEAAMTLAASIADEVAALFEDGG